MEDKESSATSAAAAMDLSTTKEDTDSNDGGDHPTAGISLVKPEVLFGKRDAAEDEEAAGSKAVPVAPSLPFSPFLASGLAAAVAAMASGGGSPATAPAAVTPPSLGSNELRNAFQEMLKLYGVPAEVAAAIAKNAQSAQGKVQTIRYRFKQLLNELSEESTWSKS